MPPRCSSQAPHTFKHTHTQYTVLKQHTHTRETANGAGHVLWHAHNSKIMQMHIRLDVGSSRSWHNAMPAECVRVYERPFLTPVPAVVVGTALLFFVRGTNIFTLSGHPAAVANSFRCKCTLTRVTAGFSVGRCVWVVTRVCQPANIKRTPNIPPTPFHPYMDIYNEPYSHMYISTIYSRTFVISTCTLLT